MNSSEWISAAPRRLSDAPKAKTIVLYYAGLVTGLAIVVTALNWVLDLLIGRTGGLSDMGTRSLLSSAQTMLSLVQPVLVMCLTLGYQSAMLRIARGQYASPNGLRLGFDRFWVLFRCTLLRAMIYFAIVFASLNLASMIYMLTPGFGKLMELAPTLNALASMDAAQLLLHGAEAAYLMDAMLPMMLIFVGLLLLMAVPITLRYRMSDYLIIDHPERGALSALRESRMIMRGNCLKLLGLDLRLWWYYLAQTAATLLCYSDLLLPMLGIRLPFSGDAAYYGSYAVYLAVQFAITCFFTNRIEVTYALAYESLRPREESTGTVLGNIFQM